MIPPVWSVAIIDPPWPKKKGGLRGVRPKQGKNLDYATMSVADIFSLLDKEIFPRALNRPHSVFLWSVDEYLVAGESEMEQRGYRRHARLIWDKGNGVAPAFSVRYSHEYLTWFYKPKFMPVATSARGKLTSVIREAAREHSRKPDAAYAAVKQWYPVEVALDVFSREARPGWFQWGNELDRFRA